MVFSSLTFLFIFFPATLILYFLPFGKKYKNLCLFILSLLFYAWGEPVYVLLMLASITVNYAFGLALGKTENARTRKIPVAASVVFNLALLGVFKYAGFIVATVNSALGLSLPVPQLSLPIGISFYTFQIMTYVIDVYRRECAPQRSYVNLGAYITMFPQLVAGPIVRYSLIERQLTERRESVGQFADGIRVFITGLAKKAILANGCGFIADAVMNDTSGATAGIAWLGIIAYSFQIFFDFSGYSTMAIGLGRMFGFEFPENFRYPYISRSITEFWRRWHITLSAFFRDYLYIPLGGNRVSKPRWLLNILIVWFATGLWHGASFNFVLWGLYYGALLVLEKFFLQKLWDKTPKFVGFLFTALATVFGWVFFRTETLTAAVEYFRLLFGFVSGSGTLFTYGVIAYLPYLPLAALFSTPAPAKFMEWLRRRAPGVVAVDLALAALFILCIAALTAESFNPFIYFRF